MADSPWVIDVDQANFNEAVIERSAEIPVLIDFWAPWCGPCRALGPLLEKLAHEMAGRFILAKINSDQNQTLAQQMGVQGIPAVKMVSEGQVIDEFTGALPERNIRQFLDKALPSPVAKMIHQAAEMVDQNDAEQALRYVDQALALESKNAEGLLVKASAHLKLQQFDEAEPVIEEFERLLPHDDRVKPLRAQLTFAGQGEDEAQLQKTIQENPDNLQARLQLGRILTGQQRFAEGMDQFLEIIKKDRNFEDDAGRKAILQVFDLLGPSHELVPIYRAKLSSLLFS
ncbi:tetratricopeptide repeat protein [Magnetococcales bacterium HHB-1]